MRNSESSVLGVHSTLRFETTRRPDPAVRLETQKAGVLAAVLSRAFHNEPNFAYITPDERARRAVLPWFFHSAIRVRCLDLSRFRKILRILKMFQLPSSQKSTLNRQLKQPIDV